MAPRVAVVGAGAFGGWTALHLLRGGARVTVVEAWGPGHSRSSSGDETRVIRGSYGANAVYTQMVARSLAQWRDNERRWRTRLFHPNGALWIAGASDAWEKASVENLRAAGLPFDAVEPGDLRRRYPKVNWEGLTWAIHEKDAGYLLARQACQAVLEGLLAENGAWRQSEATPGPVSSGKMAPPRLADGSRLEADQYVFACGAWLGRLFPREIGTRITATRQETFYFGTPPGDASFNDDRFPTWVDNSPTRYYGIPGNQWRGFKIARDVPGEAIDPTTADRMVSPEGVDGIRKYLAFRFPSLAGAPLVESRVCQYEMSEDGGLVADRLPGCDNAWIVGGGSGHGFKLGPALGEHAAGMVLGRATVNPLFALGRLEGRAGPPTARPRK